MGFLDQTDNNARKRRGSRLDAFQTYLLPHCFNSSIKSAQVVTVSRSRAVAEGLHDAVSGSNPSPVNWLVVVTVNLVCQIEESF